MMKRFELRLPEGVCECHELSKEGPGPFPPVLLMMDAFGVRPSLLDLAQLIADEGFTVLVPNTFYRDHALPLTEYPVKFTKDQAAQFLGIAKVYMSHLTPSLIAADGEAYLAHLKKISDGSPVNIVGFCMGGGQALRIAAHSPNRVKSVVSLHGGNLASTQEQSPHLLLPRVRARLYFGHADHDGSMPLEQIHRLEGMLLECGNNYEMDTFIGAHHGFTQKDLPAYHEAAFWQAFKKMISVFKG